jgi:arylsulfatase A-like enzyme
MPLTLSRRAAIVAAPLAAATVATMGASQNRPRNLLFVLADDHAGYALGVDGDPNAITPNLDRLAREGTRFAAHYCNSPVCTPSRQSFLTGQLPHAAGVTRLPTPLSQGKPTLARQFQKAGYATGVIGKMHFNTPGVRGLHGFDHAITEREVNQLWARDVKPSPLPEGARAKPAWKPFQDPARIWLNAETLPYPRIEAEMKSAYQLRLAEEFLQEHREKPFALWVSFQEPHSPYDFPLEDRGRFDPAKFKAPRVGPEDGWQIPKIFRDLTDPEKRGIAAAYYTSVHYLDRSVGRLLGLLKRLRLEEDTLVVYMADHGYCLGQHGRFEKHCGYDPALRVPLILRWPGRIRAGNVVRELTESVDLPATIPELMGLDPLPVLHGKSLVPYLEGKKPENRDYVFSEYLENEEAFIRTQRWKYIYCTGKRARGDGYQIDNPTPGPYQRLYDLRADPGEFADVAARNPKVVKQMRSLMLERFRKTHPEVDREPAADPLDFYLRPRDV